MRVNRRFAEAAARAAVRRRGRLGAGLPAAARAADAAREPPRPRHRLLQPHPVPGLRHLLAAAVAPPGHRRTARRRRDRLPARGRCRQLLARGAPPVRLHHARHRHRGARRRRRRPAASSPGTSRSRSTPPGSRRSRAGPRCRRAPARSARASATPRRSCSASTGSTTRRASATASRRSANCCATSRLAVEDVTLVQVASPSRERVETYRQLRDEIELTVGRLNGDYSTLGHQADRLPAPRLPARGDGRALPRRRRHARHRAPRRHEPRREGVRRVPVRRRRRARAQRVRRRIRRAAPGACSSTRTTSRA